MAPAAATFVGLRALRIVFAAMAIFVVALGVDVIADVGVDTGAEAAAAIVFLLLCALASFGCVAVALERVVVDGEGVHRRNLIWWDRSTPWSSVRAVRVETDGHNTHPVVETVDGKTIRLRGAASLLDTPACTARRAAAAIESHLEGEP